MWRKLFLSLVFSVICLGFTCLAETASEPVCQGVFYKAKVSDVPVYEEPKTTARVLQKLELGEKVCYVGEERDFAIIDRQEEGESKLVFVRLVDLWAPGRPDPGIKRGMLGVVQQAKRYYYYMRSGGVPEDGLIPYRPIIEIFTPEEKEEEESGEATKE